MLLEKIKSPRELDALTLEELDQLTEEIRAFLIESVQSTGGHLASNLGVVELTIALHRVFRTPEDKLIFDVGHQGYVHKLLTGRCDGFAKLRQWGGLCGYLLREESEHDAFGAGHGSTSISAAVGFACARDLRGSQEHIVAVIGDGSLTGGMAFEALNYAGQRKTRLLVVLNENEMSIAPNVGAMSEYLNRLRTSTSYQDMRRRTRDLLEQLPLGGSLASLADNVADGLKHLVVPGMLFEELGFTYIGPVDGHDLRRVIDALHRAKGLEGPVLLHVRTQKGKGFAPAERDATSYHGVTGRGSEGEPDAGKPRPASYTAVFGEAVKRLADEDPRVVAITAAMPQGTGLTKFAQTHPDRFFDVGMAEEHAITMAAGLAAGGYKPVVAIYSTFMQRAIDQMLHDVALQQLPVVLCMDRAGLVPEDGATHQGLFDLTYLRMIPDLTLIAPKDEAELVTALRCALALKGPVAIRYPKGEGEGVEVDWNAPALEFGQAEVLTEGEEVLLLAVGNTVYRSVDAARQLARRGLSATVVNARFVRPLDEARLLPLLASHKLIVTVEENVLAGGFGSAISELLHRARLETPLVSLGIPDEFVTFGSLADLRRHYGLTAPQIASSIEEAWTACAGSPSEAAKGDAV